MSSDIRKIASALIVPDTNMEKKSLETLNTVFGNIGDEKYTIDSETYFKGQKRIFETDRKEGSKYLKLCGKIVNINQDKFSKILEKIDRYKISSKNPDVARFLQSREAFCASLTELSTIHLSCKSTEDIKTYEETLQFQHDESMKDYEKCEETLKRRELYSKSSKSYFSIGIRSIKWMWNYKY